MARHWLNDGRPDDTGRICLEIDPEDGTHPLRIWGRSQGEILEKAAKTVEHGQRTILQLKTQITTNRANGSSQTNGAGTDGTAAGAASPPVPKRVPLSPSETLSLTQDIANPEKAPAALTRLIEDHTGFDFTAHAAEETVKRISTMQLNWEQEHPDFPKHAVNYRLVNDAATIRAGSYANITPQILDTVYNELSNAGLLVPPEEETETPVTPAQPDETPQTVRRPRGSGAASYRRASMASPAPAAVQVPKYTAAQIAQMSSSEIRRKLEAGEPGFAESVAALQAKPA